MVDSRTLALTVLEIATKENSEKYIETFLEYIKTNNLQGLLSQVIDHIGRITARKNESDILHIRSKYELSESDVQHIQSVTGAENATVTQHVDETVIGGFSATYAGYMYDGSLQNQVTRLKNMLIKS